MKKAKTYFIRTFGCQANEAESDKLAGALQARGYELAKSIYDADLVLVNSCSVRQSAEDRLVGLVRNLRQRSRQKQKIILTGCVVGSASGERRRYGPDYLKSKFAGFDDYKQFADLINELGEGWGQRRTGDKRGLVLISQGCDNFCTYCVVPYARGRERSFAFERVLAEVKRMVIDGCSEVMLLGQNVNSYGNDFSRDEKSRLVKKYSNKNLPIQNGSMFALLLRVIHSFEQIKNIAFLTSNPHDLTDEIIAVLALPKIDRYLHLPVQSGDDEILRRMNRKYTAQQYLNLIDRIRNKIPDIKIGTDIIVGFPGESREQFTNTLELCKKVGFEKAYVAKYSPRVGTAAYSLKDDVPYAEKKRRWQVLDRLINH